VTIPLPVAFDVKSTGSTILAVPIRRSRPVCRDATGGSGEEASMGRVAKGQVAASVARPAKGDVAASMAEPAQGEVAISRVTATAGVAIACAALTIFSPSGLTRLLW